MLDEDRREIEVSCDSFRHMIREERLKWDRDGALVRLKENKPLQHCRMGVIEYKTNEGTMIAPSLIIIHPQNGRDAV